MSDIPFLIAAMASFFAIVDPIGTLPFFVSLTEGFNDDDKRIIMNRSTLILGSTLMLFALFGRYLFAAFGFTLYAFEVAGGILLFFVAYEMLNGEMARTKLSNTDREEALARRDELSVVPLGIPLLAGPGAISTVMIYEGNAGFSLTLNLAVFSAIVAVTVITWFTLRYGNKIFRYLGRIGVMAISRIMGLLLAAIAVQFVINGIFGAIATHTF
jgi:multiple antibiotic resistance protein